MVIGSSVFENLLTRELEQKEVQEGLIRAVDVIDLIIEILRGSKNRKMAMDCLVMGKTDGIKFKSDKSRQDAELLMFTERQANAILDMRLHRLIGLEIKELRRKSYAGVQSSRRVPQYSQALLVPVVPQPGQV